MGSLSMTRIESRSCGPFVLLFSSVTPALGVNLSEMLSTLERHTPNPQAVKVLAKQLLLLLQTELAPIEECIVENL